MPHHPEPTCPHCALPTRYCTPDDAYHTFARRLDIRPQAPSGVEPGWVPLLERLVVDLRAAGWTGQPGQIKQKFAALRFYADGLDERQAGLVEAAVELSAVTCERCGANGSAASGWSMVLCTRCRSDPP